MRIWFDTEFQEDGKTIELISIGMVREDGATLYLENADFDWSRATPWLIENVRPHLDAGAMLPADLIPAEIVKFAGESPEFWAYYAAYDWVLLCQQFGTMMDLPDGWPMYCRDLKQEADRLGLVLPKQTSAEHHALADAKWTREAWEWLMHQRSIR